MREKIMNAVKTMNVKRIRYVKLIHAKNWPAAKENISLTIPAQKLPVAIMKG